MQEVAWRPVSRSLVFRFMKIDEPVLAVIPLKYRDGDNFWARDMGLTVLGLRKLGVDARLVALGGREDQPLDRPAIVGTRKDFANADWWRQWRATGIIFTGWSASRFNDIRRAMLAATPRVIERLDTDGVRSPRTWLTDYARKCFAGKRDSPLLLNKLLAPGYTPLEVLAGYWPTSHRIAHAMKLLPALAAESPIAVQRIRRFLHLYFAQIPQVRCITHPVAEDYMRPEPNVLRRNHIVSVGRWHSYQKNFPLLLKVLEAFLLQHPDWEADIIGSLPDGWNSETRLKRPELRPRLRFHGVKPHREISGFYKQSKIFLMTSRYESFNIAAAEALCCGCSVVGPVEIASVPFFTSVASGTVACRQNCGHFLDALGAEAQAWEDGLRQPHLISQKWLANVSSTAVASQFLEFLEQLPAR